MLTGVRRVGIWLLKISWCGLSARAKQYKQSIKKEIMATISFGNHSSVIVPRQDRERIRQFYCDILGGKITKADPERDFVRLGEDFYIGFLYGDVPDESGFLRTARSI